MTPRVLCVMCGLCLSGCDSREKGTDAGRGNGPEKTTSEGWARRASAGNRDDDKVAGVSGHAWFSSAGQPMEKLPLDSRGAFAFGDSHLIEGLEWRGFALDLDRDGQSELIASGDKGGEFPFYWVVRKFDGEWELIGRFTGEFTLFKREDGWMDDIVATVSNEKSGGETITTMKFDGLGYREVWQVEDDGRERKATRLAPDPVVPPAGDAGEWESPLVGAWADMLHFGGDGPSHIRTVSINRDGVYHMLEVELDPGEYPRKEGAPYAPVGAELKSHETGRIDLRTGREILPRQRRSATMRSIHWEVREGKLHWSMDMGTMGGQGVTYCPVN